MAALSGKTVIVIHGWSDKSKSMRKLGKPLEGIGARVFYANYDSREDEAVYEDFAEGLQHELMRSRLLGGQRRGLNFVTHSTGALVLRQWLRQYPGHQDRVGNVVFLAPANFGSPLASTGNSLIGKIFKGQHGSGDDFEVGRSILHGLELASPFAWALSEHDVLGPKGSIYSSGGIRASVITGHKAYGGLRSFVNKPGTDGTIVVAGANLNTRRLNLDFSGGTGGPISAWQGFARTENLLARTAAADLPFAVHAQYDHATILRLGVRGNAALLDQVVRCLSATPAGYDGLRAEFAAFTEAQTQADAEMRYQQFLFRMVDERHMPVPDYHLEFNVWHKEKLRPTGPDGPRHVPAGHRMDRRERRLSDKLDRLLAENLHTHSQDSSFKRYLIKPDEIRAIVTDPYVVTIRVDATSHDRDIVYKTEEIADFLFYHPKPDFRVRIHPFLANTTTQIQLRVNRDTTLLKLHR